VTIKKKKSGKARMAAQRTLRGELTAGNSTCGVASGECAD
jgi:hypothetical protein